MSEAERKALTRQLEEAHQELQAVTEELAAVSGELDIARCDLAALRGELQKANAEVAAINASLCAEAGRAEEVDALDAVLEALAIAAVTVDGDLVVRRWTGRAEVLWGIDAAGAVGRPLDDLGIGLAAADVRALVATVVAGGGTATGEVKGSDHRRRPVSYEITGTPARTRPPGADEPVEAVLLLARPLNR